jgi:hypothetical protein
MGGWGSGRSWGHKAKLTAAYPSLDIRRLQRDGLLRPGLAFLCQLMQNGERTASIDLRVDVERMTLSYRYLSPESEWRRVEQQVQLERTACNYGGHRAWFRCPADGCGRRVAILYCAGIFACRRCHQLAYWSQRRSASEGAIRRAQAIRERLGGTGNMYSPFPAKPKGMHWRTYRRLRLLHDNADTHSWPTWMRRRAQTALLASHEASGHQVD